MVDIPIFFTNFAAGKLKNVKFIESSLVFRSPKSVLRRLRFDLRHFLYEMV